VTAELWLPRGQEDERGLDSRYRSCFVPLSCPMEPHKGTEIHSQRWFGLQEVEIKGSMATKRMCRAVKKKPGGGVVKG